MPMPYLPVTTDGLGLTGGQGKLSGGGGYGMNVGPMVAGYAGRWVQKRVNHWVAQMVIRAKDVRRERRRKERDTGGVAAQGVLPFGGD